MKSLLKAALRRSGWIKLLLFLSFIMIIGLPGFMVDFLGSFPSSSDNLSEGDPCQATARLRDIEKEILERAETLGAYYTPDDYFVDLYTITSSPSFKRAIFPFQGIERLMVIIQGNHTLKEISEAKDRAKIYPITDPEDAKRFKHIFSKYTPDWLVARYLACMPLATVLFLLWLSAGADETRRFWPSPCRFALAIIGYPLVIGVTWHSQLKSKGRGWLAEAMLRQRKKELRSELSGDEVREIELFAKSRRSLSSWRAALDIGGLSPRHALLAALLVVIVINVITSTAPARAHEGPTLQRAIEFQGHFPRDEIESENGHKINFQGTVTLAPAIISQLGGDSDSPSIGFALVEISVLKGLPGEPPDVIPVSAA